MPARVRRLAVLLVAWSWIATPVSAAVCALTCAPEARMTMAGHGGPAAAEAAPVAAATHAHHHHESAQAPADMAASAPAAGVAPCDALGADHACCAADAGPGAPPRSGLLGSGPDLRAAVMAATPAAAGVPRAGRPHPALLSSGPGRRLARRAYVLRI